MLAQRLCRPMVRESVQCCQQQIIAAVLLASLLARGRLHQRLTAEHTAGQCEAVAVPRLFPYRIML